MGAPKQKWTAEEEAALKAGIAKHGAGKWRTILKDPEFSSVLYMRSNVDLKDKWRNMSVMANGWGSREKARMALKRMQIQPTRRQDENPKGTRMEESDEDEVDIKPLVIPTLTQQAGGRNRLDNLILEALNSLREPGGLSKTAIAAYIEEQYWAPPNFKRLLSAKLKFLTANGRLIKVKRKYMIASAPFTDRRKKPSAFLLEGMHRVSVSPTVAYQDLPTKAEIDVELAKMRNMTFEEAQIVAARALTEAEAAIAEAEQCAREAEEAEAEAREKEAFAEAAKKTLLQRNKLKPVTF